MGDGRILVFSPNHPNASKDGYVLEYRLMMERHIGRYLLPSEIIHHRNGNISDNRIENLEITTFSEHAKIHEIWRRRTRIIEHAGQRMAIFEWADFVGMSRQLLYSRLKEGWTFARAISTPKCIR